MPEPNFTQSNPTTLNVVVQHPGVGFGVASLVFGVLAFFVLAILFGPLSLIFGAIGIARKQYLWSTAGILIAVISMVTSPIIWGVLGLGAIGVGIGAGM
jgi:hypothetical protein